MIDNNEKKLILSIKVIPIVIILIFAIFATFFSIVQNNIYFKNEIDQFKHDLTNTAKQRAKEEVLKVYDEILYEKHNTEHKLKLYIKERVNEAHSIMTRIYIENKDKPKKDIIKMIQDALVDIRFNNNRGYYFIYKMNGENILLPPKRSLEGKSFWNFKDAKGVYSIREMSNLVKEKNESFYTWWWYKPDNNKTQFKKIGYGKYFEPLDWFIGTGEYVKDFENNIKTKMIDRVNNLKYGKNGYVFIFNYDGVTLSHIKKEYRGVNRISLKDANGYMIAQGIINTAKKGSGFINYIGTIQPTTGKPARKTTYIKGFEDWSWAIGSGVYLSDIDKLIKKKEIEANEKNNQEIKEILMLSLLMTLIFIVLSFYLSTKVQKMFFEYKKRVHEEIELNKQKDLQLMEQAKMASMGGMIANIAHQWRQPLSMISTLSSGIKLNNTLGLPQSNDEIDEKMDTILLKSQYLSNTIETFRDFLREEKEYKEIVLQERLDTVFEIVGTSLKDHYINLRYNFHDIEPIHLKMVVGELDQVVINILNNSKDIIMENEIKDAWISLELEKSDNIIIISIEDNGGGIPSDVLPRIFEPYFTTKHQSQGTGLGLHMSYKIITESLKGKLYAKNSENGAKFFIELPLS